MTNPSSETIREGIEAFITRLHGLKDQPVVAEVFAKENRPVLESAARSISESVDRLEGALRPLEIHKLGAHFAAQQAARLYPETKLAQSIKDVRGLTQIADTPANWAQNLLAASLGVDALARQLPSN